MDADIPTNYDIDIPTITTAEVRTAEELGINDCNNIDIDLNEREISVVLDDVNVQDNWGVDLNEENMHVLQNENQDGLFSETEKFEDLNDCLCDIGDGLSEPFRKKREIDEMLEGTQTTYSIDTMIE